MTTAANAAPLPVAADEGAQPAPLHAAYFEEIMPENPVCCGRQLLPLSIGRYRLMARLKVGFASDAVVTATAGDLLLGVMICSMTVADFRKFLAAKGFSKSLQRWGRRFGFFPPSYLSWPLIGRLIQRLAGDPIAAADARYLGRQMVIFQKYIEDGTKAPNYWDESPGGRASGAHWSQCIEVVLRGDQGWTMAEIDEECLGKALWDYFKHMENQGLIRLISEQDNADLAAQEAISEASATMLAQLVNAERAKRGLEAANGQ